MINVEVKLKRWRVNQNNVVVKVQMLVNVRKKVKKQNLFKKWLNFIYDYIVEIMEEKERMKQKKRKVGMKYKG